MGKQVREGEAREARCVPWEQDVDGWRADQGQLDEEQEREDREQEAERERQEGLQLHQGLDSRRDEGHAPVQEGEGVLQPVSLKRDDAWQGGGSQLQDVGLSHILSERWSPL